MIKLPRKKAASLTCFLLILTSAFMGLSFLPKVGASVSVSLSPSLGYVGAEVELAANVTTANGTYQVFWDSTVLLANTTAIGNSVDVILTIPPSTYGYHNITVVDVKTEDSGTATFSLLTAYFLSVSQKPAPEQWQEGDDFDITLNMTGGVQNRTDFTGCNITVVSPDNKPYVSQANITTLTDGNGTLTVNYPMNFSIGASTNFTGQYAASFYDPFAVRSANASSFVGLTNSSQYHRDQVLDVKAVYEPGENVTLSITGNNLNYSQSIAADNVTGTVHYVGSTILLNTSASSIYTVNLTSVSGPTVKVPHDVQNFTVPGFPVNVTTRNLAGEPVPNMLVKVFENLSLLFNRTSGANGLTTPTLEVGSYVCNASFSGEVLGSITMVVNETSTVFDLPCNLTNLKVLVVDEDGFFMPDVQLSLVVNQTSTIAINSTDVDGASTAHSLLPVFENAAILYTVNASRYGMVFSTTSNFTLPIAAWYNLTVVCPKENLHLNVTDARGQPIMNASVNAIENAGGLLYSNDTSADGTTTLRATFGRYLVQVYVGGIKLNETTIDLNYTTVNATINCSLYGLDVSIKLTAYFGQAIPNLNVTLAWVGYPNSTSIVSGSDGIALFRGIVGGNLTLTVSPKGQSRPLTVKTANVYTSTTIEIRLDKYIVLAGMLVDLGQFVIVLAIVLIAVFIVCLEVYRRRRSRPQQGQGLS